MKPVAVSDTSCLLTLGTQINATTASRVRAACALIEQRLGTALIDLVPSYTTVLVEFDPLQLTATQCLQQLADVPALAQASDHDSAAQCIEIPVYYGDEVAPDMAAVCQHSGLSRDEIIRCHSAPDYRVYAIGFAPGFCFLGTLDPRLQQPRRAEPRPKVPAGSVAIAEQQTAVYPLDTPGGWHLIGRTTQDMLALCSAERQPLRVGDHIRFVPVARTDFVAAGGSLK